MADMVTDYYDPTLHTEHAAIRHDIGLAEANIRDKVGNAEARLEKAAGDNRYTIASEAASLSRLIGSEACGINKHIGDVRQEDSENFGHTRRDIMAAEGNVRREVAQEAHNLSQQMGQGFCDTDSKVLGTSSDIRREQQSAFGDVRREGSEHTNEIIKEGLKGDFNTRGDIKDARYDVNTRIGNSTDRVVDRLTDHDLKVSERFFTVGRDLMDLRQGQATLAKDVELNSLKTQIEGQKNTQYLSDKISTDGEKTRALINDLKYHDLNRVLVERNNELVECAAERRHWRHHAEMNQFAGQWAQLQNQVQAFQSQLQETRQGMVNFGTMAGVGQSSTSNNVR